jgi:hypothetical protein
VLESVVGLADAEAEVDGCALADAVARADAEPLALVPECMLETETVGFRSLPLEVTNGTLFIAIIVPTVPVTRISGTATTSLRRLPRS